MDACVPPSGRARRHLRQSLNPTNIHERTGAAPAAGIARDVPLQVIFRGAAYMLFALCLTAVLLILSPQIALFLPGFMR